MLYYFLLVCNNEPTHSCLNHFLWNFIFHACSHCINLSRSSWKILRSSVLLIILQINASSANSLIVSETVDHQQYQSSWFIDFAKSSLALIKFVSHDRYFLKPYLKFVSMLLFSKCFMMLICNTCSKTLHEIDAKRTGL